MPFLLRLVKYVVVHQPSRLQRDNRGTEQSQFLPRTTAFLGLLKASATLLKSLKSLAAVDVHNGAPGCGRGGIMLPAQGTVIARKVEGGGG